MGTFDDNCLGVCSPAQIINLGMPVNDVSEVTLYDSDGTAYCTDVLKYSYSVDGVCWSCYMSFDDVVSATFDSISDYFLRIKVRGDVAKVSIDKENTTDYTVSFDSSFNLDTSCEQQSPNVYNPYANIDGALQLQQSLTDAINCVIGIPIYYFKVNGVSGAADMTFKEYALKSVSDVKQIKLIVTDGTMPSSRPEFTELGLDWQTDWETEISKSMFATAFGINAQPTEGDLIYIPMMKRMWAVSSAYDERNGSLMWKSTTWKVMLMKYQTDGSLDLNEHDDFVNDLVKTHYEDLFGDDDIAGSGTEAAHIVPARPVSLYPVFRSDAVRKEMTCDSIDMTASSLYHKGTLIADNAYILQPQSQITYQHPYCGDSISISFLICCEEGRQYNGSLFDIGHIYVNIAQKQTQTTLSLNVSDISVTIENGQWHLVTLRWSKQMHLCDITASIYRHPDNVPVYQLSNWHYYFDVDNATVSNGKWNIEMDITEKSTVMMNGFYGQMTNIKVMDVYDDNMSELLQQYPTHSRIIINDTARPIYGLLGTTPK